MNLNKIIYFLCFIVLPLHAISLWHELFDYEAPEYKKFAIIICSCNNKNWYEKNLESAFSQNYPRDKFRILYLDESRDGTAELVSEYVTRLGQWDRFTLNHNDKWQSVMHNHYKAAHMCQDDEIIVHLDGDDFFKHEQVLSLLNKAYNKWDIWLTYGQYETWPDPAYGFSIDVPHDIAIRNEFRDMGFWYSHLRTCYAWLFKSIHLKDLIWQGSFIPTTPAVDYMFMFPMMEMAGEGHYLFIEDVLYLYNRSNSLSTCNMPIKLEIPPAKQWEKYQPLSHKNNTLTQDIRDKKADLIILSFDQSNEDLRDYRPQCTGIDHIQILTRNNLESFEVQNDHCLIITDTSFDLKNIDLSNCIYELERTFAKAFFLGLSKESFHQCNIPINYGPFSDAQIEYRLAFLGNGIAAWQCEFEDYVWNDPGLTSAILMRKKDWNRLLSQLKEHYNTASFNNYLHDLCLQDERAIGLVLE